MQSRFSFIILSKYRAQLMGIAAIGILLCHASGNGVQLPSIISYIFGLGNFGVDLFLLLSGFSMYHSLSYFPKSESIIHWYKKRFSRLLIPYLILSVPYWAYVCIRENAGIVEFLYYVSTAVYWVEHRGAWFIALIIPLYLLSPLLMRICTNKKGRGDLYVSFDSIDQSSRID